MAFDPTSDDKFGMVALNGTTEVTISLDVRYQHKIIHTGDDVSGNDDASSALSAWISTVATSGITADGSVEDEKYELLTDTSETFGPGISMLYIVSTAGADAVLKIVRIGTPTNSY